MAVNDSTLEFPEWAPRTLVEMHGFFSFLRQMDPGPPSGPERRRDRRAPGLSPREQIAILEKLLTDSQMHDVWRALEKRTPNLNAFPSLQTADNQEPTPSELYPIAFFAAVCDALHWPDSARKTGAQLRREAKAIHKLARELATRIELFCPEDKHLSVNPFLLEKVLFGTANVQRVFTELHRMSREAEPRMSQIEHLWEVSHEQLIEDCPFRHRKPARIPGFMLLPFSSSAAQNSQLTDTVSMEPGTYRLSDVLRELEQRAERLTSDLSDAAFIVPNPGSRYANRNYFVRNISVFTMRVYGTPLYEIVASTARVVLDDETIDISVVYDALKDWPQWERLKQEVQ